MKTLASKIADFNEKHGIAGSKINNQTVSNAELRNYRIPGHVSIRYWKTLEAYIGRTVKRPRGKQKYTIREVVAVQIGHSEHINLRCDTPDGERLLPAKDLKSMEIIS